jgi:multicomponent Na+:H+ antiporter subunit D
MAAFAISSAGLMGLPLTFGFLTKYRLIEAAVSENQIWIVAVIAVSSLLTLVYVGRMLEALFFKAPAPGAARAVEAPLGVLAPLWILAGASVWFGVDASLPEGLANWGALALLGARP